MLLGWWVSLLATSDPLDDEQRALVDDAIVLLDERGFSRQAFVLRHVTSFRSTDNWWNLYHDHYQAYAATNFPFEIVTLYPWFFELPADDVERAVVLLHEAYHLMGADEATALRQVWREKARSGGRPTSTAAARCGRTPANGRSTARRSCSRAARTRSACLEPGGRPRETPGARDCNRLTDRADLCRGQRSRDVA